MLERAELRVGGLHLCVSLQRFLAPNDHDVLVAIPMLTRLVPLQLKRRGFELRLVIDGKCGAAANPDPALLVLIGRARAWFEQLRSGEVRSTSELAARLGVHRRQINYLLPLAFLSPDIVEIIIAGLVADCHVRTLRAKSRGLFGHFSRADSSSLVSRRAWKRRLRRA